MKTKLKKLYYHILKLKNRFFFGRPVMVLMYHRINDEVGEKLQGLTVSVLNFERHLIYFKEKFQIVKLDEDWALLKKTGIVITFDDGYADNLINALPLLEKYNIPATIFVTTLNIDENKEFWWDRLVFDYTACNELFNIPDCEDQILKSKSEYKNINDRLDKLTNHGKEKWFLAFEKMNQIPFFPRKEYRSLTKSELKLLSEHPLISIGIHTHNHYPLANLTYEEQKQEFLLSITKLNELTNKSIKYLALPHGSYNLDTLEIAEELKLEGVLLANDYYSSNKNKKTKKINRILMPNIEGQNMIKRLRKFYI